MVGHIHQQEEVTFVRVTGRGVFLTYLYAVDFRILIFLQPLHVIVRKTQVDEFVQFERTGQVGQIGLLVITVIFDDVLPFKRNGTFFRHRRKVTLHDIAHDDDGIIGKDVTDIIQTFQAISRLVVFQELHDQFAGFVFPSGRITVQDI